MKVDCIIALSNEMDQKGNLNPEGASRVDLAVEQWKQYPQACLITCGWNYRSDAPFLYMGTQMKKHAIRQGVPEDKIFTELHTRDTVGEALFSKIHIVKKNSWTQILVVTSSYHVMRANAIFNFIYGPSYHINTIGVEGFDIPVKLEKEVISIKAFQNTFSGIEPGDDVAILNRLIEVHPYYNGTMFPKLDITIE